MVHMHIIFNEIKCMMMSVSDDVFCISEWVFGQGTESLPLSGMKYGWCILGCMLFAFDFEWKISLTIL